MSAQNPALSLVKASSEYRRPVKGVFLPPTGKPHVLLRWHWDGSWDPSLGFRIRVT